MNDQKIKNVIAQNIAKLRKQMNLTQAELAEKINYSDKAISKWERAEGVPDFLVLVQLSNLFGIEVGDFLKEEPIKVRKNKHYFTVSVSILSIWLIAILVYSFDKMLGYQKDSWMVFIYALSLSAVLFVIFSTIWYRKSVQFIASTLLTWQTALLLFLVFKIAYSYLWFIVAIPIQLILTMIYIKTSQRRL